MLTHKQHIFTGYTYNYFHYPYKQSSHPKCRQPSNSQQPTTNIQQATSRQTDGIISQKSADIILYSRLVESRSSSLSVFVFGCCCRDCCRRSSSFFFCAVSLFEKQQVNARFNAKHQQQQNAAVRHQKPLECKVR